MSKNNVYISYSIPNEHYAKEVAEFLKHKGANPIYWKMGTPYEKECLSKSDAVVFILGCYYWSKDLSDLTRGVRKELDTALQLPIYIAYMRKDGALQVYKAIVEDEFKMFISNLLNHHDIVQMIVRIQKLFQKEDIDEKLELYD